MQTVPGTLMSDEPYTITQKQWDALNTMPPGVYLVCSKCRRFNPMSTSVTFTGDDILCEPCAKGVWDA